MSRKRLTGDALRQAVADRTGHSFADMDLLKRALTHASARGAAGKDYQRLEFLGDRVLGLLVSEMLFRAFPEAPEGELSVRLNALVNAETLAEIGEELALGELIETGMEMRASRGRNRINLRADVVEALLAALYLEGGMETARAFVARYWTGRSQAETAARRDPKTELQEWAHRVSGAAPAYEVTDRQGPDHAPVFTVSLRIGDYAPATGKGRSKREAEQAAATMMLEREGVWTTQDEEMA